MAFGKTTAAKPVEAQSAPHAAASTTQKDENEKVGTDVAKARHAGAEVPSYLVEGASGAGVSTDAKDNIVPLVYVLHKLSPQCDEEKPEYIPGAKQGMFYLRNATPPLVSSEEGLLVQPVHFAKDWGEWLPREQGGGMAGRHPNRVATRADVQKHGPKLVEGEEIPDVPDAKFTVDPKNRQKKWTVSRPDGKTYDLIFTRSHALRVFREDGSVLSYVLPLKSTGHSVSKAWMGMMMSKQGGGKILDSYSCLYRLGTRTKSNAAGSWAIVTVADAGFVSAEEYRAGKALHDAFASGDKVADFEEAAGRGDDGGSGDDQAGPAAAQGEEVPF